MPAEDTLPADVAPNERNTDAAERAIGDIEIEHEADPFVHWHVVKPGSPP